jgi:hypothetical protein
VSKPKKTESNEIPRCINSSNFEPAGRTSQEPKSSQNGAKEKTVAAIKEFLKQNSSGMRLPRECKECRSPMQYLDAYFWLDGTDVASVIPLPFCPVCQPDVLTSLRRRRGLGSIDIAEAS